MAKVVRVSRVLEGEFSRSEAFGRRLGEVEDAIRLGLCWPEGGRRLILPPKRHVNGVIPLQRAFRGRMAGFGWEREALGREMTRRGKGWARSRGLLGECKGIGDIDFVSPDGVGLEFELGNHVSFYRDMFHLAFAMRCGLIRGGVLAVPTTECSHRFNVRTAHWGEVLPWMGLNRRLFPRGGTLAVVVFSHDQLVAGAPDVPKKLHNGRNPKYRADGAA